ncbi:hypothetical protein COOONC_15981 [Cooperia oncophora]
MRRIVVEEESDESEEESEHEQPVKPPPSKSHSKIPKEKVEVKSTETAIDLLLDLDFSAAGSRQVIEPELVSTKPRSSLNT